MTVADPPAGDELERILARYARVRLEPGPGRSRRARMALLEAAWRRRLAIVPAPVRRRPFAGWRSRRLGGSLAAAVLAGLVVGTSAFAASRAGGPLYETRLAVEALALPAEPGARVDAQLAFALARLAEAAEAAGRHDDPAIVAALTAYDRTIDELAGATGEPAARALAAVRFHHDVLLRIAAIVPDAATAGVARALASSEAAIERLSAASGTPGAPGGPMGGTGPGGGPADTGGRHTPAPDATLAPTAKPSRTPKPARTTAPEATPRPTQEPKETLEPEATDGPEVTEAPETSPQPTAKPGRTPPPRRTPDPGGAGGGNAKPPAADTGAP